MPREADLLPDWFLGGAGKRRLLTALLVHSGPDPRTEAELARAAGLHPKNTVRRHLAVLAQAGLVHKESNGFSLDDKHPLVRPLRHLLKSLENELPKDSIVPSRGGNSAKG